MSAAPERVASTFANSSITMQDDTKVCSAPPYLLGISMPMKPLLNMALSTAASIFISLSIRWALGAKTSRANLAALSRMAVSSAPRTVQTPGVRLEKDTALGRRNGKVAAAQRREGRKNMSTARHAYTFRARGCAAAAFTTHPAQGLRSGATIRLLARGR